MQINMPAIKPTCSPFLGTSYAGWLAWLHGRTLTSPRRTRRDVTGIIGSGLGVLNSIDAEVLVNKLSTTTSDLNKLEHPLRSSLLALGTNQWLLSDILPQWKRINERDHQVIVDALGVAQTNVSLALSFIQAQLWMQSMVAAIVREGEEGTLPTEIRKVIWHNATKFEKEFQSWWYLINFIYDPISNKATAFVLTIHNASVHTIYPIIALGLNHNGTVLYPLERRVWAHRNGNKWQTVDVNACVVREQQGFICESNTIKAQDICLDTEQNVYNITVDTSNCSNICVCNFTKIVGCDFNYSAPVMSYQLLQSNYTLSRDLLPTPIGMNLTLNASERMDTKLITVHHDAEEIHHVLERVKKDGEHHWWETLLGWSPTARGVFNLMLHPVVILLTLTLELFAFWSTSHLSVGMSNTPGKWALRIFKEDVIYCPGKWTTMEKGIQYLRELAMLEGIYGDLDDEWLPKDPDEVQRTRPMWRKLVWNAPSLCANSLAILNWKDREGPTVDEAASQLWEDKESISSSLVSAVEKLSRKVQQLREDRSYFPPVQTSISAVRSQCCSAQERGYRGYTPRGTLWFYLCDNREDVRKWAGKPTSTLEVRVRELQGKTITKGGSSRTIATPVSSGQFPRQSKRADLTPDFNEGTPDSYIQEMGNEYYDQA
ncbi:hypothetical protein QYF61_024941 [Mycteria americana]|uniref:Uncharacterized protein n=1 Tax=Mycteria americana TaxID=33587 RepID=A0AAN7PTT9_MYCAM|nr:hypothetical protein QYF61_024941 [Mycteria americana]